MSASSMDAAIRATQGGCSTIFERSTKRKTGRVRGYYAIVFPNAANACIGSAGLSPILQNATARVSRSMRVSHLKPLGLRLRPRLTSLLSRHAFPLKTPTSRRKTSLATHPPSQYNLLRLSIRPPRRYLQKIRPGNSSRRSLSSTS